MCPIFKFKQFSVNDDGCAMKVNTDGVLLGAWADISRSNRILDIGTGCGLIALILAQRNDAIIDAIDIHKASVKAATRNVNNSPWAHQINIYHASLHQFLRSTQKKYDHIISNPPFFESSLKSPYETKNIAKHADKLTFSELIGSAGKLILKDGKFSVILPADKLKKFKLEAEIQGLYCTRVCHIKGKVNKVFNRVMLEFSTGKGKEVPEKSELVIRGLDNHFTSQYRKLTESYYLNF